MYTLNMADNRVSPIKMQADHNHLHSEPPPPPQSAADVTDSLTDAVDITDPEMSPEPTKTQQGIIGQTQGVSQYEGSMQDVEPVHNNQKDDVTLLRGSCETPSVGYQLHGGGNCTILIYLYH